MTTSVVLSSRTQRGSAFSGVCRRADRRCARDDNKGVGSGCFDARDRILPTMTAPQPITLPAAQGAAIKSAHVTPPRAYHDFSHVRAVLRHYDEVAAGPGWAQPIEVFLAILYHYANYDTGSQDNKTHSTELTINEIDH